MKFTIPFSLKSNQYLTVTNWEFRIKYPFVGIFKRYLSKKEWRDEGDYYSMNINSKLTWGHDHGYYEGNHCSFGLGLISLNWSKNEHCAKCREEHDLY